MNLIPVSLFMMKVNSASESSDPGENLGIRLKEIKEIL
jgi:hypothetical protein